MEQFGKMVGIVVVFMVLIAFGVLMFGLILRLAEWAYP